MARSRVTLFCLGLLAAALTACGSGSTSPSPQPGAQPADGWGTPIVDGNLGTAEWNGAQVFPVFDAQPSLSGSVLYVMNDATNIYLGLRTTDKTSIGERTGFEARWDNTGDGMSTDGDDQVSVHPVFFGDRHLEAGNYVFDAHTDGFGDMASVGEGVNVELSHPLNSGDGQDIAFTPGQRIRMCVHYSSSDLKMGTTPTDCNLGLSQNYFDLTLASH